MPIYRVHIDSRSRDPHTLVSQPSFSLSKTISGVREVRVKHVQLANSIYNIRQGYNDTIQVSNDAGVTFVNHTYIMAGFYDVDTLLSALNVYLQNIMDSDDEMVRFDTTTNRIEWLLQADMVIGGPNSVLGIEDDGVVSGDMTTLFLSGPMDVSFVCPQLQSTYNVFTSDHVMGRCQPFLTMPITNGFGTMEYFHPSTQLAVRLGGQTLSSLDFRIVDTTSGLVLHEVGHWSMVLEVCT